jgi:hypothetical protein
MLPGWWNGLSSTVTGQSVCFALVMRQRPTKMHYCRLHMSQLHNATKIAINPLCIHMS